MNVGVEVLGERFDDYARTKLLAIRPALVKCRHPAVAAEIIGSLPDARILARSPGEGFERGDIIDGYGRWLSTLTRYADRFLAYEFANEPNDHSIDPEWWASMAIGWLSTIDPPVDLCTPGLIRYNRRQDWERGIARIPRRHPNGRLIYRGKHVYWQQDGWQAAIDDVLGDGLDPADVLITEINTGHARAEYHPTLASRAEECRQAIAALARLGYPAATIFALTPWQDWGFSYDVGDFVRILAAGITIKEPTGMYALDISNYSGYLTPSHLQAWRDAGVGLVLVRLPIPGVEQPSLTRIARQQIESLTNEGMPWQGWHWMYPEIPASRIVPAVLDFLRPLEHAYHGDILWVDVETDEAQFSAPVMPWLRAAEPMIRAAGYQPGIYTSAHMWAKAQGAGNFASWPLWDANYNGTPGQGLIDYGGWNGQPVIHQYRGTSTVGGVTVDQNWVLSEFHWGTAPPAEPVLIPTGLAHLDAAYGHMVDAGKLTRSVRIRDHLLQAQDELVLAKQAAGWE